jgi:hypothetical protein
MVYSDSDSDNESEAGFKRSDKLDNNNDDHNSDAEIVKSISMSNIKDNQREGKSDDETSNDSDYGITMLQKYSKMMEKQQKTEIPQQLSQFSTGYKDLDDLLDLSSDDDSGKGNMNTKQFSQTVISDSEGDSDMKKPNQAMTRIRKKELKIRSNKTESSLVEHFDQADWDFERDEVTLKNRLSEVSYKKSRVLKKTYGNKRKSLDNSSSDDDDMFESNSDRLTINMDQKVENGTESNNLKLLSSKAIKSLQIDSDED